MKSPHTSLEAKHLSVMIDEVVEICNPKIGGNFMDCTFGGGGYSKAFLKFKKTNVLAIDRDSKVTKKANKLSDQFKSRFLFFNQEEFNKKSILELGAGVGIASIVAK